MKHRNADFTREGLREKVRLAGTLANERRVFQMRAA
jgi:hypothetical protein